MKAFINILVLAVGIAIGSCGPYVPAQPQNPTVLIVPDAPGPGLIWVQGSWHRNRKVKSYHWVDGYWAPRRNHTAWVDGHWVETRRGYRYINGHWR